MTAASDNLYNQHDGDDKEPNQKELCPMRATVPIMTFSSKRRNQNGSNEARTAA